MIAACPTLEIAAMSAVDQKRRFACQPIYFRSTLINGHSQNPSACLRGAKRHCTPCALFGGPSGAPRRSKSVRMCERILAYCNNSFSRSNSVYDVRVW
jgi:hypothetical protein